MESPIVSFKAPIFRPCRQMVLLMGIPATGKTTFVRAQLAQTHTHVSLDRCGTRFQERTLFLRALCEGKSVVIDNTNVTRDVRRMFLEPAREAGYECIGIFFRSVVRDAIERNEKRSGNARIPRTAVACFSNRLELPSLDEGFSSLWFCASQDGETFDLTPWRDA